MGERRLASGVVLGATSVWAAVGAVSVSYHIYAEHRDRRRFPPPGEIVDVPGLGPRHLWQQGAGDGPPIVVIGRLGGSVTGWADLAPRLAEDGPVLLYDRDGIGWSPPTRRWSTSVDDQVHELAAVLGASRLDGPYLLVGHSIGGVIARHYASRPPRT